MLYADRETVALVVVAAGGSWLVASALLHGRSGRWSAVQRRGLYYAGAGFLAIAASAFWLHAYGPRGAAVSLVGALFAMRGMLILVRERVAERALREPPSPK